MGDLEQAVSAIVRDCLGVREGEELLVVANPATIGLGERFRGEAGRVGADGILALIAERAESGTEPPDAVAAAMAAADVVLCPTVQSLSHTVARKAATEAGARIATLPGATEEMLARVMSADMDGLRRKGAAIAAILTAGAEARVTCANGSDLRLGLGEREAIPDAGDLTAPGAFGNLPCGEGFIAPIEGSAGGHAGRRRDDRLDRPGLGAGRAHGRGRPSGRRHRRRGRAAARAAANPRRRAGHQRRRARDRHQREGAS